MKLNLSAAIALISLLLVICTYFTAAPLVPVALILTNLAIIFGTWAQS
jgi:hypothetical protein